MLMKVIKFAGKAALGIAGLYVCDKAAKFYADTLVEGIKEARDLYKEEKNTVDVEWSYVDNTPKKN